MKTYGPYEPFRVEGNLVFVSGQVGINQLTGDASQNFEEQMQQAIKNLKAVLPSKNLDDILKTTVYLTDMGNFEVMNQIYIQCFNEPRPARACVGVSSLPNVSSVPLLVEIEAVAKHEEKSQ